MTTVIIPAHNEGRVLGALLESLLADAADGEFDIIVVSNGSTDDTAAVAATYPGVRVVEIGEASKYLALQAGDAAATSFPRLYVDADIELSTASVRALADCVSQPDVLAAAPKRTVAFDGSSWAVRAYYDVWERLPAVREGLYGRGVLAVNERGYQRIADRPDVIGDDLYFHSRFEPAERRIMDRAVSVVRAPRTLADLLRRRTRAARANSQLGQRTAGQTDTSLNSGKQLLRLTRAPRLWPGIAVFATVTVVARLRALVQRWSRSETVWLRDESSRL